MAMAASDKFAIIQEGGGQRRVTEGMVIDADLINGGETAPGTVITFDKVLLIGSVDGKTAAKLGLPFVAGAKVTGEVVESLVKGEKIHIFKFRRRKGYRRKTGHRQKYTSIKITGIVG
jgi:large subunit ribosomal protein L21